jgi:predicted permease
MSLSRLLRIVRQRVRALWRRETLENELDRELAFHLDHLTAEFIADGLPPVDARLAARRALGNAPLLAEQCRDHRGDSWLRDFHRDVGHGVRLLRRNAATASVIVASLALGIGANTAVLGALDTILRTPMLIPDAGRVLQVRAARVEAPADRAPATVDEYLALADRSQSFSAMALVLGNQQFDLRDADGVSVEHIQGVAASPDLTAVLQVAPALGRFFTADDARSVRSPLPVVLSHGLWQRRFGGSPDAIGRHFRIGVRDAAIVGVMPAGFRFRNESTEFWVPLVVNRADTQSPQRVYGVFARLKPGVTAAQAEADVNRVEARLARQRPDREAGWTIQLTPVRDAMYGWTRQPLWTLEAAVALVLLVACTNVAGLLLARAVARRSEMVTRATLGASRGRLVRQLLTEAIVLAAAGGALGLAVAWASVRALSALAPPPGGMAMVPVTLDVRLLLIAMAIALASGLLFGVAPAFFESRRGFSERRNCRYRELLVAAQIAVTFVLLIGAGLLTRTFLEIVTHDVRFDHQKLLTFQLTLPLRDFLTRRGAVGDRPYFEIGAAPVQLFQRVHEGLRALPDVRAAGGTWAPIVNALVVPATTVQTPRHSGAEHAQPASGGDAISAAYFVVTPQFLTGIGAHLRRGRDLAPGDIAASPWVAVVNETAARRLWPTRDPIGQQLSLVDIPAERPRDIVGVIADIPLSMPEDAGRPVVYLSYLQQPDHYPLPGANLLGQMMFVVRTAGEPMAALPAVRRAVARVDPARPLLNVQTMDAQLRARVPRREDYLTLIGTFAAAALLLAAIGIYSIVSYTAAMRTREIGIRMALGARAWDIVHLIGRRAAGLVAVGLATGLVGALALTRLLRAQLWHVSPTDPLTYAAVSTLLLTVYAIACALPTRRATTVNPTIALRCE